MTKLLNYLLLLIILSTGVDAYSTEGTPYLIHYQYSQQTHNQIWSIEQSPRKTILIAKRTGLLEFDSESWEEIETPDIPLKIHTSYSDNTVYISGRGYIGKLIINKKKDQKRCSIDCIK